MRRLLLASRASRNPMGQQAYEASIIAAVREAADLRWRVDGLVLTSLRARDGSAKRLPLGLAEEGPAWIQRGLGLAVYPRGALVHRLDLRLPPAPREVVTVHDLAPLRFPDEGRLPRNADDFVSRARAVICPSEFAADEVTSELSPRRVVVVHNGVADDVWQAAPLSETDRAEAGLPESFVLHAGGATLRKNLAVLAEAWSAVEPHRQGVSLLLCGPPDERRDRLFANAPGAKLLGRVSRDLLLRLMKSALAVVVPSVYEGFGLPALEAMACGTPVIAADAASLPEVCGDAALLVSPTREGIASGLEAVLDQPRMRAKLRAAGPDRAGMFSWKAAAEAHLRVYDEVLHDA